MPNIYHFRISTDARDLLMNALSCLMGHRQPTTDPKLDILASVLWGQLAEANAQHETDRENELSINFKRPGVAIPRIDGKYQRPGIDHDPIQPWMWATMVGYAGPVEVLSYPIPHEDAGAVIDDRATIMVRTIIGDPTTLVEVPLRRVACFNKNRHELGF